MRTALVYFVVAVVVAVCIAVPAQQAHAYGGFMWWVFKF